MKFYIIFLALFVTNIHFSSAEASKNCSPSEACWATPGSGTYANEVDYFEPDWQNSFWGVNYSKLLSIKQKYDPDNVFTCHHCVGSEKEKNGIED